LAAVEAKGLVHFTLDQVHTISNSNMFYLKLLICYGIKYKGVLRSMDWRYFQFAKFKIGSNSC